MITRFAPSPTGFLHIGNIRAALFNWLAARARHGGAMQLRLEDTDEARGKEEYAAAIVEDLAWLGIDWQGDDSGEPYRQRQAAAEHEKLFNRLKEAGRVYRCFCKPEELAAKRAAQLAAGKPPKYDGKCAAIADAESARRAAREEFAWRFRLPTNEDEGYVDAAGGGIHFPSHTMGDFNSMGDFVIRRANGGFTFLFANAADDLLCRVTHVLRGEDHVSNTPRQRALFAAWGEKPPEYGHLSLLVGANGKPLSKRDGLSSVRDLRRRGFLPAAIWNYLARVGHFYPPPFADELHTKEELAENFSLERLGRAPAQYDAARLQDWQKTAVAALPAKEFDDWLESAGVAAEFGGGVAASEILAGNIVLPAEAEEWRAVFADAPLPSPTAEARACIAAAGSSLFESALAAAATEDGWNDFADEVAARTGGKKGKALFLPLRAALTGRCDGPPMQQIYPLLPAACRRQRLQTAAASAAK